MKINNVLFCSGGKDSVASLILAKEHGEPLDAVVFVEVMFDKNISGENPLHLGFIMDKLKPYVEKEIGVSFIILRAKKTYLDCFYRIVTKGKGEGKHVGFPIPGMCVINRDLKMKPIREFRKAHNIETEYVGIAIDEPERLTRIDGKNKVSLLAKYGYTRAMAKELCIKYDLFSPVYEISKRNGCWFCMNCNKSEWIWLIKNRPELFEKLVQIEQDTPNLYRECLTRTETATQIKAQLEVYTQQLSFF